MAEDAFEEGKHQRDEGGKFSSEAFGSTNHKADKATAIEHVRFLRNEGHTNARAAKNFSGDIIVAHGFKPVSEKETNKRSRFDPDGLIHSKYDRGRVTPRNIGESK